ncbi:hypothetical protein ACHQM5_002242 [Ranunculus cassubicifolius]
MSSFQRFLVCMVVIILVCNIGLLSFSADGRNMFSNQVQIYNQTALNPEIVHSKSRKLLFHGECTNRDISISQSKDSSSGIPQYIVFIVNTCVSGCAPSNIHLRCGWFASARMVNPKTFKRLNYDDCLLNQGKTLKTTQVIRFTYSNSFMYPLPFKSAKFC